ncbi:MAG: hypothetical protein JXR34_08585 [Bacteroidales bacterium]|nr:hypothetical protein [Bacteroidales bacterium]
MKAFTISLVLLILTITGFSQNLASDKKEKLWRNFFFKEDLGNLPESQALRDSILLQSPNLHYKFIDYLQDNKYWSEAHRQAQLMLDSLPKDDYEMQFEIRKLLNQCEIVLMKEEILIKKILKDSLFSDAWKYRENYPLGEHIDAIKAALPIIEELNEYRRLATNPNLPGFKRYFKDYANGRHRKLVDEFYANYKLDLYNQILISKNLNDLLNFKYNFEFDSLNRKLKPLLEEALYIKMRESTDSYYFNYYLENFPRGKHIVFADSLRHEFLFNLGVEYYKEKSYHWSHSSFTDYKELYPQGSHIEEVDKYLKKLNFILSCMRDKYDHSYFIFGVDQEPSFSFSTGNLKHDEVGFYLNIRAYFFNFDSLRINEDGTNNSNYDLLLQKGLTRKETFSVTAGATMSPLQCPVWFYTALGVSYYAKSARFKAYNIVNNQYVYQKTHFAKFGWPEYKVVPEIGVIVAIKKTIMIRYGLSYNGYNFVNQVGIGFALKNPVFDFVSSGNNDWLRYIFIGWPD